MDENFPAKWNHGAADCQQSKDPLFQSHAFSESTFIIRQSKCSHFEAPFMYLLIGETAALLIDSGAAPAGAGPPSIREFIESILETVHTGRGRKSLKLIVAHSHAHGDHTFGDALFVTRPETFVVPTELEEIRKFYGIKNWPEGAGSIDLGNRTVIVIPAPGHEEQHLCFYDPETKILLTGDTFYPGLLVISDWPAYRASAGRLARFAGEHSISFVLGAHIEMKKTPRHLYPIGTKFQPDERILQLTTEHLTEWARACSAMGLSPVRQVHRDFVLAPE